MHVSTPKRFWFAWARSILARAGTQRVIIALAVLLASTSLTIGMSGDDYLQLLMVREQTGIEGLRPSALNIFALSTERSSLQGLMNEGVVPWWVEPTLHFEFFRPLTSLTHQLDYRYWPEHPVVMHVHSLLWFAFLLWAVGKLFQRFEAEPWVAGLALLLYAIDDARSAPVAWLANRNALVATALPVLGLLEHDRWRKQNSRGAFWLSMLWFALGFAAGEASVQVGAYLLAYVLFLERGALRARARSLAPYLGIALLWRVAYAIGEFGVRGSSAYIDPVRDPMLFFTKALVRLPILLLAQFAVPYAEVWELLTLMAPSLQAPMFALALAVIALVAWLLWPSLQRDPVTRFWVAGTLLATLPACAAVPNDRLLTATGIGASALVARFLAKVAQRTFPREGRLVQAAFVVALAIHVPLSLVGLPLRAKAVGGLDVVMRHADKSISREPEIEQREVVLLNPPVDPMPIYFPGFREAQGIPRPHYLRWIATGASEIIVTRLDDHTLSVRLTDGFLSLPSHWFLRGSKTRSFVGEKVELADCTFEVRTLTEDARPLEVHVTFKKRLDDPSLVWMQWGKHEYVPFPLPDVGQSVTVPPVDMLSALLGLGT